MELSLLTDFFTGLLLPPFARMGAMRLLWLPVFVGTASLLPRLSCQTARGSRFRSKYSPQYRLPSYGGGNLLWRGINRLFVALHLTTAAYIPQVSYQGFP